MDEEDEGTSTLEVLTGSERPSSCIMTTSMRKERQVIVVCDSLLRGTAGPICQMDPPLSEVCCLPGTQVKVINDEPDS